MTYKVEGPMEEEKRKHVVLRKLVLVSKIFSIPTADLHYNVGPPTS